MSIKQTPSGFTRSISGSSGTGNAFSRPAGGLNIQGLGGNLFLGPGNILIAGEAETVFITDDNASSAPAYLVWVPGTNAAEPEYTSSMQLSYIPSTGVLSSIGFAGDFEGTTTTQPPLTDNATLASTAYVDAAVSAGIATLFPWYEVTGPTTMAIDSGYVANNSSLVILTLPPISPFGAIVRVVNKGAGGWMIAQGSGQIIHFGNQNTTSGTGGALQSQSNFDVVELLCTTPNTNWTQLAAQGNITVI